MAFTLYPKKEEDVSMFSVSLSRVPVIYGLVEILAIGLYLVIAWKLGWSKAPKDENVCTVIRTSYEIHDVGDGENENEGIEDEFIEDDVVENAQSKHEKETSSDEVRAHVAVDTEDADSTFDTVMNAESLEAEGDSMEQGVEMSLPQASK